MAVTEIYVDPSINANSGTGTSGDPYGDLQYCLDNATRDATNGTRINIKAGTAEVLTASLSFATFGNSALGTPTFIQGYTTTAGDGGIGEISGAGSYSICNSITDDALYFVDMKLHNSGSNTLFTLDDYAVFVNCELYNCGAVLDTGKYLICQNCIFRDFTGIAVDVDQSPSTIRGCFFDATNASYAGATVIRLSGGNCCFNTLLIKSGSSNGIETGSIFGGQVFSHNSIYSNAGTGTGLYVNSTSYGTEIANNAVQGFSGTGGKGFNFNSQNYFNAFNYNIAYNNATNYANSNDRQGLINNETASANLFADAGNADYTNYITKFAPEDVEGMLTGGAGGVFKGAVPPASSGGGGTVAFAFA